MNEILRRLMILLLGALLGYLAGFSDARRNDEMVFVRAVEHVQDFAKRTLGEREREVKERLDEIGR